MQSTSSGRAIPTAEAHRVVEEYQPVSTRAVRSQVTGRNESVSKALRALEAAGVVIRTADGWIAATGTQGTLGHGSCDAVDVFYRRVALVRRRRPANRS